MDKEQLKELTKEEFPKRMGILQVPMDKSCKDYQLYETNISKNV